MEHSLQLAEKYKILIFKLFIKPNVNCECDNIVRGVLSEVSTPSVDINGRAAKQTNNDKEVNFLKGFENSMVGKKETLTLEVELVPQDIRDGVSYALGLPDSEVPFLLPTSLQIPQLIPRPSSLLRSDSISVNHPITLIWREGFTLHLFLGNMVYAVR